MQFLTIVKTVLSLLPLIIQAITAVEQSIGVSGQGAAKLDLIKQILQGSADISDDLSGGKFDQVWPAVQRTISALVGLFNATGVFKK